MAEAKNKPTVRIAVQQAKILALIGFLVGLSFASYFIANEFQKTTRLIETDLLHVLSAISANHSAPSTFSEKLFKTPLSHTEISAIVVNSANGKVLAQKIRVLPDRQWSAFVYTFFGQPADHTLIPFTELDNEGSKTKSTVSFTLDPYPAGKAFIDHSIAILTSEILRAILIAALVFIALQRMIGRSLLDITNYFLAKKTDPKSDNGTRRPSRKSDDEIARLMQAAYEFSEISQSRLDALQKECISLKAANEELSRKKISKSAELAVCKQELHNTNALFGAAFYSNSQLASISDMKTGEFVDVNDMWVETRGISRLEAIGKTADELNIWGGELNRKKIIDDIVRLGKLRNYETTSVMRSGEVRDFILNAEAITVDSRILLFFSGMDITDRKKHQQDLQRAQKMEAVGQLTGGIAHDFNNLLAIIQGNLELIKEASSDNMTLQKMVDSALHGAYRGVNITNKLLGFSGRRTGGNEVTQVNSVIGGMKELIAKSVTASISVETEFSENACLVDVDPSDLEDAIINLSLNAHDAMPGGGILTIKTYNTHFDDRYGTSNPSSMVGDYLTIEISDTGCGLPENIKDRIFEPFFTTKDHGKGTGLGLSMVFGFVERSNGHINVVSEPENGTTFTLHLPKSKQEKESQMNSPLQNIELPRGVEKILIVDDEISLVDIAKIKLEDLGYTVSTAENGPRALSLLKREDDIKLLFSDVVMPGDMNGYQLSTAARDLKPHLKILLTSGYTKVDESQPMISDQNIQSLKKHLLAKPYSQDQLAHAIRKALDAE